MALLERDLLLDDLDARLAAATGHGSLMLIAGEAGAGKTSLVAAQAAPYARETCSSLLAIK